MKTLYFDAFSGASGDMILGALIDLGGDYAGLRAGLARLSHGRFELRRRTVVTGALAATKIDVRIRSHDEPERNFREISALIEKGRLAAPVRDLALEIFRKLCEAEAAVHGVPFAKVHLHEAGAIDAIADVCGAAWLIDALGADRIVCSALNVGSGTFECRHGTYPVPGPATAVLLREVPIYAAGDPGERVTPTGAAILSAVVSEFGPLPPMIPRAVGHGAGDTVFSDRPNVLRAILGEHASAASAPWPDSPTVWRDGSIVAVRDLGRKAAGTGGLRRAGSGGATLSGLGVGGVSAAPGEAGDVVVIETTIDDMNPQNYGFLVERTLASGALDVFLTPVLMKKGRPGIHVTAIVTPDRFTAVSRLIFRETTTIGFRFRREMRRELARTIVMARTRYGIVRLKISSDGGEVVQVQPEFEDCRRLAEKTEVPLKEIQRAALAAWRPRARVGSARRAPRAAAKRAARRVPASGRAGTMHASHDDKAAAAIRPHRKTRNRA